MGKSDTTKWVLPPLRENQQSRNSVSSSRSRDDDDKLNDDKYAKLIDNYQFDINVNNVIHNVYLDHLDHSGDSKFHHHHLTAKDGYNDNLDFIHHHHDGASGHDHNIRTGVNYDDYGPDDHDHSVDGATEHGTT